MGLLGGKKEKEVETECREQHHISFGAIWSGRIESVMENYLTLCFLLCSHLVKPCFAANLNLLL